MSDMFHEVLMEDAARINVSQMTWKQVKQGRRRARGKANWKRRLLVYGASAAILVIVAIGASGFVSPVMAKALQKIPIVGKLYSFTYLPELNRYASDANPSVTDKGITISVPKAYYDGKRLYLIYAIQVPQGYKPVTNRPQINILSNKVQLNGKPLGDAGWEDSLVSTNMYRGNIDWHLFSNQMPQEGTLTIPINQVGTIKGNWMLSFPVSSVAVDNATHTELQQNASRSYDGITITVKKVTKGPVFTAISMQVRQELQANGKPKHEIGDYGIFFSVCLPNHHGIGFGRGADSHQHPKKIGNEEVWDDITIQCTTPSDDVKSIIIEPSLPILYKKGVKENCPNIPQLAITVPLN